MASIINATTTNGLVTSADTSGIIELQNNGTTKLTVNSSGATIPTATVTTLNTPSGVLATQNGMTGIAKAWVAYNGVSQTILGSFNVSSVTFNGAGDYTINFTTAMANANYASCIASSTTSSSSVPFIFNRQNQTAQTTSAIRVGITASSTSNETSALVSVIILGS